MGCIEILVRLAADPQYTRLIETWDVLKYGAARLKMSFPLRLIETWDVLK